MKRKTKALCIYGIQVYGIAFMILLFFVFVYKCPMNYFFHVPCPGCGITRAHFAAVSLDIESAFRYHPLFFTVLPAILYLSHRNVLKKRLSDKAELVIFSILLVLFVVVYIVRLLDNNILFSV